MYFTICPLCRAHLDPCEKCDCLKEKEKIKAKLVFALRLRRLECEKAVF